MYLSCCGLNHHANSLEEREPFQISREDQADAVVEFKSLTGAQEAVILATCNRIEFYRADKKKVDAREDVKEFYRARGIADVDVLDKQLFVRQGTSVARHLFKVTSGLDSALLGEYQILGQVKESYSAGCSVNGPAAALHKLFHYAFQVSKRVRSETEIGQGAQGLAGAAVDVLTQQIGVELADKHALVIGVNRSAELLLQRLHRDNIRLTLINRTLYKAEKIAHLFKADVKPLEKIKSAIASADIVFSITASPDPIILPEMIRKRNASSPLFIIDLAVPRDVHPDVQTIKGVTVLDLDDLKRFLDVVQKDRAVDLPIALDIIEEQVVAYEKWRISNLSTAGNTVLRKTLDEDRILILDRFRDNFRNGDHKALEAFSRNLYRQFLRRIMAKQADPPEIQ